jgi:hypothetical protein
MTRRLLLALLAGLLACGIAAGALTIEGSTTVREHKMVRLIATGADDKAALVWDVSDEDKCDVEEVAGKLYLVAPPGSYKVKCRAIKLGADGKTTIETARATVTVQADLPPGPGPGPNPGPGPGPGPDPGPAPIPTAGFRVLMVYESGDLSTLPTKQLNVLYAQSVRDYLNSKCIKGEDGKTPDYRIWDKDVDPSKDGKVWADALKTAKGAKDFKTPWLLVSNGKAGYNGPLPADVDTTLALLKKYGDATTNRAVKKGKPADKKLQKGGRR